jgi:hypothetical protein
MRGNVGIAALCFVMLGAASILGPAHAQKKAPKAEPPAADGVDVTNAPEALRGKSIIIDYMEIRTARPDGGGPSGTRMVPFQLVVYISSQKRVFNRLSVPAGSSDQVKGKDAKGKAAPSKDRTGFAPRTVVFDGPKLSVSNTFGGGKGFRDITATFEDDFTKCTSNVVITIHGEFARQTKMGGGFEELLSAKHERFRCSIQDGNALAGS